MKEVVMIIKNIVLITLLVNMVPLQASKPEQKSQWQLAIEAAEDWNASQLKLSSGKTQRRSESAHWRRSDNSWQEQRTRGGYSQDVRRLDAGLERNINGNWRRDSLQVR